MIALLPFAGYFIVMGTVTTRMQTFHFTPQPIAGRAAILKGHAAIIAGQANIGTGIVIAVAAACHDPLPLVGVAALVFCSGIWWAFTCQRGQVR